MARLRISLAQKCQLLFGLAVVLILAAALSVPLLRMQKLVDEADRRAARGEADKWLRHLIDRPRGLPTTTEVLTGDAPLPPALRLVFIIEDDLAVEADSDRFLAEALHAFNAPTPRNDLLKRGHDADGESFYRYARAVRQSELDRRVERFKPGLSAPQVADKLRAVLLIDLPGAWAQDQLRLNSGYIVIAGLLAGSLAIAVFWYLTTRIILSPVRVLRETAETVAQGDLNIRSDISTGDEFEQLSDTFNTMLRNLKQSQDQLQALNKNLDMNRQELAESNVSLFEANRLKDEFLANVSHELRTPLNSIIGFAEVLSEIEPGDDTIDTEKQRRYLRNIVTSSRSLMQLITELLDLARIEAGRVELSVQDMSIHDVSEGLVNLMRPQADRKNVELTRSVQRDVPIVRTDPGKFQQVIFNFLSNAIKFTPHGGHIELGAAPEPPGDDGEPAGVRMWVTDSGPGIPHDQHATIFEKFQQIGDARTREHGGSGLGLAISRELAQLLQGRIELVSEVGQGATFALIIPAAIDEGEESLMPDPTSA